MKQLLGVAHQFADFENDGLYLSQTRKYKPLVFSLPQEIMFYEERNHPDF